MTPLNALFDDRAPAALIVTAVAAVLLAAVGATLDVLGVRPDIAVGPALAAQRLRERLFLWAGLPSAVLLLISGGLISGWAAGVAEVGSGATVLLWAVNAAFIICVIIGGLCSPLVERWTWALVTFAGGCALTLALLWAIYQIGAASDGLLTAFADRAVFGLAAGCLLLGFALCGASTIALLRYAVERSVLLFRLLSGSPGIDAGS